MSKERLMTVLIQPHVSEKAANVTEKANQYVFRVRDEASKDEVEQAVGVMLEVRVEGGDALNATARVGQRAQHPEGEQGPGLRRDQGRLVGPVLD